MRSWDNRDKHSKTSTDLGFILVAEKPGQGVFRLSALRVVNWLQILVDMNASGSLKRLSGERVVRRMLPLSLLFMYPGVDMDAHFDAKLILTASQDTGNLTFCVVSRSLDTISTLVPACFDGWPITGYLQYISSCC
jgi:hypothetical protein